MHHSAAGFSGLCPTLYSSALIVSSDLNSHDEADSAKVLAFDDVVVAHAEKLIAVRTEVYACTSPFGLMAYDLTFLLGELQTIFVDRLVVVGRSCTFRYAFQGPHIEKTDVLIERSCRDAVRCGRVDRHGANLRRARHASDWKQR